MKKIFSLLICGICLCFTNTYSSCIEPCPPCPEFTPPSPPSVCAYNAPDSVALFCQWDVFVKASFLWLEAKQENLGLGTTISREFSDSLSDAPPQSVHRTVNQFDFEYKPGFKIGIGVHFDCDNWDLYGQYTYFRSKVDSTINQIPLNSPSNNPAGGALTQSRIIPDWYSYTTVENFTSAEGSWDLSIDIGDLELGRQYYVGRCLSFRTFAALRSLWIKEDIWARYSLLNNSDPFNPAPEVTNVYTKTATLKSWAIGPRFGLDSKWDLCGGFRIFATPSASILFTKYAKTKQRGDLVTTTPDETTTVDDTLNYSQDPCFLRPEAEITLGFGWGDFFYCNRWFFDLEVGYSTYVFWNQNIFLATDMGGRDPNNEYLNPSYVKGGDLYLHGLIVTLRLEF